MKLIAVVLFAGCVLAGATPHFRSRVATKGMLAPTSLVRAARHAAAAAPAAAPSGAPGGGANLTVLRVSFLIENVNYYDLTATEDGSSFRNSSAETPYGIVPEPILPASNATANATAAEEEDDDGEEEANITIDTNGTALLMTKAHAGGRRHRHYPPLLTPSVLDNVLGAVHLAVEDLAERGLAAAAAPGPAAASPSAAGPVALSVEGAVAAAPAPAGPEFDIHVTAHAGEEAVPKTLVEATIVEAKSNGIEEEPTIKAALEADLQSGILEAYIEHNIENKTGLKASVGDIQISEAQVQQWSAGVCEPHLQKVVARFSVAYTRGMVPMALYNECTNFLTKLSFSHDGVLNQADSDRCRAATLKISKKWNYGKGGNGVFAPFCIEICELKYGKDAPQCQVDVGESLAAQES